MSEPLYTLAYFSRSQLDSRDSFVQLELLNILLVSRLRNGRSGVTGCLLLNHGCFSQVLEGSREAVEPTFERIECDPRHRSVSVLYFKPLERRLFTDFAMAHASVSEGAYGHQGLSMGSDQDMNALSGSGDDLAYVLKSLVTSEDNAA
jgi:hypothetical protein